MKTKQLPDGSVWARIHWLDVSADPYNNNSYFANEAEVLRCLNQPSKFSLMEAVEDLTTISAGCSNYKPLKSLNTNGTQYFDTGLTSASNITRIEAEYYHHTPSQKQILFGMYDGVEANKRFAYFDYIENSDTTYTCMWYGNKIDSGVAYGAKTVHSILTVDNSTFTYSVNDSTPVSSTISGTRGGSTPFYLFADNSAGNAIYQYKCNLHYFKVWVDGKLARYYVPCKNSDSIVLFDKVNQTICNNIGSGQLIGSSELSTLKDYEFMLTYPQISTTGYNRWAQTSSPNTSDVKDYYKIGTQSWTEHCGPIRKQVGSSIYNCDNIDSTTWYAAIGQLKPWQVSASQAIPAANGNSTFETELWIRIDDTINLPKLTKLSMFDDALQAHQIYEL